MSHCSIRRAQEMDSKEIARLAGQLGYPASDEAMHARLKQLLASPNDAVFVADSDGGALAGWIHGVVAQYLESDRRAEIAGLVVDVEHRRHGLGRELVTRVEQWAIGLGMAETVVRCRTTRPEARLFYENLGYDRSKTQIVFKKSLASGSTPV